MKQTTNNLIYRCGQLIIDPQLGQVKAVGEVIRLGPVNMKVLVALIDHKGQVVSRAQLFDSVWPNQIVNDDVLTRCISDLRAQLASHSEFPKLIETIPKRGYRWLPEVVSGDFEEVAAMETKKDKQNLISNEYPIEEKSDDNNLRPESKRESETKRFKIYVYWILSGIIGLLILSTSTLWIVEKLVQSNRVQVALFPIQIAQGTDPTIASELDDILRGKLLETEGIRFLARSAVASRPQNPYPYFAREFGTRWIIEGQVSSINHHIRISLSLVDAKTAIVYYSKTDDIENTPAGRKYYCDLFIKEMSELLDLR